MRDFMTEQLVQRKTIATDILIKIGLIFGTIISFFFFISSPSSFMSVIATILFIAFVCVDVYLFPRLNVEFEYTYFEGTLDIAKIMNKQARKEMFSTDIKEDMEIIAPTDSPELQYHQVEKILDFSTRIPENKTYTMVTLYKGQKVKMIFEPNEKMLNSMRDTVPRKVIF